MPNGSTGLAGVVVVRFAGGWAFTVDCGAAVVVLPTVASVVSDDCCAAVLVAGVSGVVGDRADIDTAVCRRIASVRSARTISSEAGEMRVVETLKRCYC